MADVKISQLPVATTPVDGTEVLPIVQSATTKQVSIANLTAGRAMSASSLTLTTPLAVTSGGTGIATAAQGSLLSATGADTFSATRTPTLGLAGTAAGTLGLSGSTSGVVTLATAATAGTWTFTLPTSGGTNGFILTTNGSGVTTWTNPTALGVDLDVGSTAITGGTTGRVLYNNAGVLGEYSVTGTGSVVLGTTPTFTTSALFPAGTVGAPGISVSGDTNTGIYFPAADTIGFVEGGAESMRLDSSGNLGLGVTPSAWYSGFSTRALQVGPLSSISYDGWTGATNIGFNAYQSAATTFNYLAAGIVASRYSLEAGAHKWFTTGTTTGAKDGAISFTQAMTLDASGNLGVGTTSPNGRVHGRQDSAGGTTYTLIADNGAGGAGTNLAAVAFQNAGTQKASIRAAVYGNGYMAFHTDNDTEKMRIDSFGNVGIGTTSPGAILDITSLNTGNKARIGDYTVGGNSFSLPAFEALGSRGDGNTTFEGRIGLAFRRTDGTAIQNTSFLGMVAFGGQHGTSTGYVAGNLLYSASIKGVAEGAFTSSTAMPTAITFSTGSSGDDLTTANRTYGTERMRIDANGNVIVNTAAIATNATNGFLYVPTCAGTPTGTPTTYTGRSPIVVDTTNNKLYFYSGGTWRDAGP